MKLLGTNTSPYVHKVRLVLLEKNIPHIYLVDPPRELGSQVARVNPLGSAGGWHHGLGCGGAHRSKNYLSPHVRYYGICALSHSGVGAAST
jgi:hypothetical protein